MRLILITISLIFLFGCASVEYTVQPQSEEALREARKIIVFFDGTANDEASRTNVAKLHNLVSLQNRSDIHTIYIKGVGTDGSWSQKISGMASGRGIGKDVRQGYDFIANRYSPHQGDEIFLFGFSRGAYAARIVAGLIEIAGVPKVAHLVEHDGTPDEKERKKLIKKIYFASKGEKTRAERASRVGLIEDLTSQPAKIEFMGLWDTVEALGVPTTREHVGKLNPKYLDQLCNIKRAAHALSIDDNRARLFTPVLLTQQKLVEDCPIKDINIEDIVSEVWFSGAHADVGGGYHDTDLSGVSLNWMLGKIRSYNIVPEKASAYEDVYGLSHNPDEGIIGRLIYWKLNRNIPAYAAESSYKDKPLPIHSSVIERLTNTDHGKKWHEFNWLSRNPTNFPQCFSSAYNSETKKRVTDCHEIGCILTLSPDQTCFKIEETKRP